MMFMMCTCVTVVGILEACLENPLIGSVVHDCCEILKNVVVTDNLQYCTAIRGRPLYTAFVVCLEDISSAINTCIVCDKPCAVIKSVLFIEACLFKTVDITVSWITAYAITHRRVACGEGDLSLDSS